MCTSDAWVLSKHDIEGNMKDLVSKDQHKFPFCRKASISAMWTLLAAPSLCGLSESMTLQMDPFEDQ